MRRPKRNHLVFIVDRSGSMSMMEEEAIGGFNNLLWEHQASDPEGRDKITYVQFDDFYELLVNRKPLKNAEELTNETYKPRGLTALLDAIGKTINRVDARPRDKVIVSIITDGIENASKEFNVKTIKGMIETKQGAGWAFLFACASMEQVEQAVGYGIPRAHTIHTAATKEGTTQRYGTVSNSIKSHKVGGNN